ncbi:MAG TPA: RNA polymerase sigma factor [Acidimicrobiia bacterium]|nr:RNA polymerase sigma factor [Acidimicrobiia bacterium]
MLDPHQSDAEIIAASQQNPELFGQIFRRHHSAVFKFAARRVGLDDAGDVAAEVFDRAFRIRRRYDTTKPNSLPWLYGIAANVVGDQLRRSARRQYIHLVVDSQIDPDDTAAADDRIVAAQLAGCLNRALAKLSKRDRETLMLYALEDLSYSEIAQLLDIPNGTVGSRINRARARILEEIPDLRRITEREAPPGTGDAHD